MFSWSRKSSPFYIESIRASRFIIFVAGEQLNNIFGRKASSSASSLGLCAEWEQQSQMVNKCSFEAALHKTRFLRTPAVSSLCCSWVERQPPADALVANTTSSVQCYLKSGTDVCSAAFITLFVAECFANHFVNWSVLTRAA